MGRPKLPPSERKRDLIMRVHPDMRAAVTAAAEREKITLTAWSESAWHDRLARPDYERIARVTLADDESRAKLSRRRAVNGRNALEHAEWMAEQARTKADWRRLVEWMEERL